MTEAEALDEAAKAAGWRDWKEAHERTWELDGMRAHAKAVMENAALKAENERLREALERIDREPIPFSANPVAIIIAMKEIARTALERIDHGDR